MRLFDNAKVNRHWRNNLVFFICILVLFIIGPSLSFINNIPFVSDVFFTLLVLSGVFVIDYEPRIRKILGLIGFMVLLFLWAGHLLPYRLVDVIGFILLSIYLFTITISLIIHVAASKDVNANIIFSAINGYLLVGIIGGISLLIMGLTVDSPIISNIKMAKIDDYIYFSFVTLTTLGYGDITPISSGARVVSMLLSITGQLYIAILIAMLVGKFLSKKNSD